MVTIEPSADNEQETYVVIYGPCLVKLSRIAMVVVAPASFLSFVKFSAEYLHKGYLPGGCWTLELVRISHRHPTHKAYRCNHFV